MITMNAIDLARTVIHVYTGLVQLFVLKKKKIKSKAYPVRREKGCLRSVQRSRLQKVENLSHSTATTL